MNNIQLKSFDLKSLGLLYSCKIFFEVTSIMIDPYFIVNNNMC